MYPRVCHLFAQEICRGPHSNRHVSHRTRNSINTTTLLNRPIENLFGAMRPIDRSCSASFAHLVVLSPNLPHNNPFIYHRTASSSVAILQRVTIVHLRIVNQRQLSNHQQPTRSLIWEPHTYRAHHLLAIL